MNPISILDLISILATLAGLAILVRHLREIDSPNIKVLLLGLFGLVFFLNLSNVLEWSGITASLVAYEDIAQILIPVLWGILVYDLLRMEVERRLRSTAERLRGSQERYRTVVEDMPALICRFLPDGILTYVNQHYSEYFNKPRDELVGENFFTFIPDEDREGVIAHYASLTSKNPAITYEHQVISPDGSLRWQRWTDRALFDDNGQPSEYQSIGEDITDRKLAEERDQLMLRGLRNVIEAADELIQIPDPDTFYRRSVELAREKLGVDRSGLFLIDDMQTHLRGTYGTNENGGTTDERDIKIPMEGRISLTDLANRTWATLMGEWAYWEDSNRRVIGEGWTVATLVGSMHGPVGILYNDSAISHSPVNEVQQETISVYCSILGNILERKRAEQALRRSEARLRALTNALPDLVFVYDWDGKYVEVYTAQEELLITSETGELEGKNVQDILPEEIAQGFIETIQETIQTGQSQNYEYRLDVPAGSRWFEGRTAPLLDKRGGKDTVVWLSRDVTDRKRAEQALRESENRYRSLIELSPDGIGVTDPIGNLTVLNQQAIKLLGYDSPDELIGMNSLDLVAPEFRSEIQQRAQDAMVPGSHGHFEYALLRKEGNRFPAEASATVLFDSSGDPQSIITIFRDITERKEMEKSLFEEKERAQVTLHSIGDAVITTDDQGFVQYLNPIAENLTGWTQEEANCQPLSDIFKIIDEKTREPASDPILRCLREGKIVGLANRSILISRDGREFGIEDSAAPIRDRDGQVLGVVLVFHDVTEARHLERKLAHDAAHDALTGLVNRREFEKRLQHAFNGAKERDVHHVLCYLDLDQFKVINDTAGHAAGDELLKRVSQLLGGLFRQSDTLARLGGDEFGLLLENCPLDKAVSIAGEVVDQLKETLFVWEGQSYQIGVSIGIVPISVETDSIASALSQADVACYTAKDLGRGRVHVYRREDGMTASRHGEILQAARLRDAVDRDRFQLYCQPIMPLGSNSRKPVCYELLLRLKNQDGDLVLPGAFIPPAERYGLMAAIDQWVIRETFRSFSERVEMPEVNLAINLSGTTLNDETLLDYVQTQFREYDVQPQRIWFEITETAAIQNLERAQKFTREVRQLGCQISLDDFGTGLSSFRYLKALTVDYLKIDGTFVQDMLINDGDRAMVAAINQIGQTLGIKTIAEHVANQETADRLCEMGVDYAQGFGLGKPVALEECISNYETNT